MLHLKPLSHEAIPHALAKAERYRLLNEPGQAESICQDILDVDPTNQQALVMLLLALTDRFEKEMVVSEAKAVVERLEEPYDRHYYAGIIQERLGRARLSQGGPNARQKAY